MQSVSRVVGDAAADGASGGAAVSPNAPPSNGRGRGRGRQKSRGRGRGRGGRGRATRPITGSVHEGHASSSLSPPPANTIEQLAIGLQGVKQAVEALTTLFVDQVTQNNPLVDTMPLQNQMLTEGRHDMVEESSSKKILSLFIKCKPPTFSGVNSQEDPLQFLEDIERICEALRCTSRKTVELAIFQLRDMAQAWFDSIKRGRAAELPTLDWERFKVIFLEQFLPTSVRDARAREFETLRQIPGMTVDEYCMQFTQLEKYASHVVPDERERIKRFVMGLSRSLFRVVAPQMNHFSSFAEVVDCVTLIQSRDVEDTSTHQKSKKHKANDTSFSKLISSDFSRGTPPQSWQCPSRLVMGSQTSSQASFGNQKGTFRHGELPS